MSIPLGIERKRIGGDIGRLGWCFAVELGRAFPRSFKIDMQEEGDLRKIVLHLHVVWIDLTEAREHAVKCLRVVGFLIINVKRTQRFKLHLGVFTELPKQIDAFVLPAPIVNRPRQHEH